MSASTHRGATERSGGGRDSLAAPLTPLIGREREAAAVRRHLLRPGVRLLTLTGPPGVGKTRLAQAVAARAAPDFEGGVHQVALAPLAEPALVLPAIARALGVVEAGDLPLRDRLWRRLRGASRLLVLDNVEHLLPAGDEIAGLLAACSDLTVLATSRVALRLSGEHRFVVPPLAVPLAGPPPAPEELATCDAVRLFVARAAAVRAAFALTPQNGAAVAEVCRRLEGLPLAIELAAARVSVLPPEALRARLAERGLALLAGGARDQPARQQTLRAAIAWSYDLLGAAERALFRRLGVCAGGFTLDAAEALGATAAGAVPDVLEALGALVDASLVEQVPGDPAQSAAAPRYRQPELLRAFALERLADHGEAADAGERHAAHFLALAEAAAPDLMGQHPAACAGLLEAEHANLRAALRWWEARATEGHAGPGLRLAAALWPFWFDRGYWDEGRGWLQRFLDLSRGGDSPERIAALHAAGFPAWNVDRPQRAWALYEEGLAACLARGDRAGEARARLRAAHLTAWRGERDRAVAYARASLAIAADLGLDDVAANAQLVLGWQALLRGAVDQAETCARESLRHSTAEHAPGGPPAAHANLLLADVAQRRGDAPAMAACLAEALRVARRGGGFVHTGRVLRVTGHLSLRQGDPATAAAHLRAALTLLRDGGALEHTPACLVGLAGVAAAQGRPQRAAALCGAAVAGLRVRYGRRVPIDGADLTDFEHVTAAVRATLTGPACAAAWEAGAAMTLEAAIDDALAGAPVPAGRGAEDAARRLTQRELEVAALVAEGLSNRELAARLVITERTAENHVAHILDRLGFRSRVQIATWATERGVRRAAAGTPA